MVDEVVDGILLPGLFGYTPDVDFCGAYFPRSQHSPDPFFLAVCRSGAESPPPSLFTLLGGSGCGIPSSRVCFDLTEAAERVPL